MDLYEALLTRRTIFRYRDEPVPEAALERAFEAARWAPNHKLTEPWRFYVVGNQTKHALGAIAARLAEAKCQDRNADEIARQVERAQNKILQVPALVVVTQVRTPDDDFREKEDYAAVSLAIHNLVLSLWADGLGSQWSTGGITRDDSSYEALSISPDA
jgi:nitroreductase